MIATGGRGVGMISITKMRGACPECGSYKYFISNNKAYCGECEYYD